LKINLRELFNNPQPDSITFGAVLNSWAKLKSEEAPEKAESLVALLSQLNQSQWEQCKPEIAVHVSTFNAGQTPKGKMDPKMWRPYCDVCSS
jgi:hypothetical protein